MEEAEIKTRLCHSVAIPNLHDMLSHWKLFNSFSFGGCLIFSVWKHEKFSRILLWIHLNFSSSRILLGYAQVYCFVLFCFVSYQSCLKFSIFFQTTNSGLLLLWDVFHLLCVKWWPLTHLLHLSLFRNLPIHKLNLWTPSCLSFIFSICTCLFFEWFLLLGISCH